MNSRRSSPGCFGYGCVIAVVLFTTVIGGTAYWARKGLRGAVQQYTTSSAPVFEISPVSAEAVSAGVSKFNQLRNSIAQGGPISLDFSENELRGLIEAGPLKGRLEVSLASSEPSVRFSLPLSIFGDWKAASFLVDDISSRAVLGSAQGAFSIVDGKPSLRLSALTLNNASLGEMARGHAEEWIVGALLSYPAGDTASSASESENNAGLLTRVKSLRVEQGRLYIELK